MARSGMKHISLHGLVGGGGEGVLMVARTTLELVESLFAQRRVTLHEKGAERALAERSLASGLVNEHAEFHVYIGELRKCVVVAAQRDMTQRQETFFRH